MEAMDQEMTGNDAIADKEWGSGQILYESTDDDFKKLVTKKDYELYLQFVENKENEATFCGKCDAKHACCPISSKFMQLFN